MFWLVAYNPGPAGENAEFLKSLDQNVLSGIMLMENVWLTWFDIDEPFEALIKSCSPEDKLVLARVDIEAGDNLAFSGNTYSVAEWIQTVLEEIYYRD